MLMLLMTYIILKSTPAQLIQQGQQDQTVLQKELTPEQWQAFIQQRITIEPEGGAVIDWASIGGTGIIATWRKWKAYKGFKPLTEEEFFRLTGYTKEAQKASEYKSKAKRYIDYGIILLSVGIIMECLGAFHTKTIEDPLLGTIEEPAPNWTLISIGALTGGTGIGMIYLGYLQHQRNWAPYSIAKQIADRYNRSLLLKIRKEF